MKPIVFEPNSFLEEVLDKYLEDKVRSLMRLGPEGQAPGLQLIPYDKWRRSKEGSVHQQLMNAYVLTIPNINARTANRIQRALQARGQELRGRPKQYDARLHDMKTQRLLRLHFLNELIAKGLGLSTEGWPPPIDFEMEASTLDSTNAMVEAKDNFDMLYRFEAWTGVRLPRIAWLVYTREDREKMAAEDPSLPRDEVDGSITLALYEELRYKFDIQTYAKEVTTPTELPLLPPLEFKFSKSSEPRGNETYISDMLSA